MACLVGLSVATSAITLLRLTAAPRYMSLTAFRIEAGTAGRPGVAWPPGYGSPKDGWSGRYLE
jgi:hypothetical protein